MPGFYDVTYKEDGTIEAMTPNNPHAPQTVSKQLVMDMSDTWYPEKPVVPLSERDAGPCGSRDHARLYPRMPFLPGGHGIPSRCGAQPGGTERSGADDAKEHRT